MATKDVLGVSVDMISRRRHNEAGEFTSIIYDSNTRERAFRRRKDRKNLPSFDELLSFDWDLRHTLFGERTFHRPCFHVSEGCINFSEMKAV